MAVSSVLTAAVAGFYKSGTERKSFIPSFSSNFKVSKKPKHPRPVKIISGLYSVNFTKGANVLP